MLCFNTSFFGQPLNPRRIELQIQDTTFQVPVLHSNQIFAQQNVIGRPKKNR